MSEQQKGIVVSGGRLVDYTCGNCHKPKSKEQLTAKLVRFLKLGRNGKQVRQRTVAWLCDDCLAVDPHWNLDRYSGPGYVKEDPDAKSSKA